MIIIADSGATKTDWLVSFNNQIKIIRTEGINPVNQTYSRIEQTITQELMSQLTEPTDVCKAVHFYGAGCLPTHIKGIHQILSETFSKADIHIETDLLGAARALCGHSKGIACILGTGANSCLYDGNGIEKNISPLGYILGDEGSGAYLGKRFLGDCFKEQLPSFLRDGLLEEFKLTYSEIINKVYKEPQANRFLASLTPYIYKQKEVPAVHTFLIDCFETFFRRNVLPYHSDLPVSFTGSISWYFKEEVTEAATNLGLRTGIFLKNPIEGMAVYHGIQDNNKPLA